MTGCLTGEMVKDTPKSSQGHWELITVLPTTDWSDTPIKPTTVVTHLTPERLLRFDTILVVDKLHSELGQHHDTVDLLFNIDPANVTVI